MPNDLLFLKNWKNLQQALSSKLSPNENIVFELASCTGWGMRICGTTRQGTDIALFCTEEQMSKMIQLKIGAPDLFSLPSEWWPAIVRQFLKPFETLLDDVVEWKNFYLEKKPFENVASFRWLPSKNSVELQIFCIHAPYEWIEQIVIDWSMQEKKSVFKECPKPIPFWIIFGALWVSQDSLNAIELDDVFVLQWKQESKIDQNSAWLFWAKPIAVLNWSEDEQSLKVLSMNTEEKNYEAMQEHFCFGLTAPVMISAMIGQVHLTLEALQQLSQGTQLQDNIDLYDHVLLLANGLPFAHGALIESEGEWMVQITKKLDANTFEQSSANETATMIDVSFKPVNQEKISEDIDGLLNNEEISSQPNNQTVSNSDEDDHDSNHQDSNDESNQQDDSKQFEQ